MKLEELAALVPTLSGDFRTIEPHLISLDKHLTLRTFLDGYQLGDNDSKIWVALASNRAAVSFILKKGNLANLTRWYTYLDQNHPEIQGEIKKAAAAKKEKVAAASKAGGNYSLALQDADQGVVTRFLPEPSGYLHIGHAKAALLSDYFAHQAYNGTLRLRLDDTNPSKEKEEYQDAIVEDLQLMGVKADKFSYTSDYFQYLYEMCMRMIKEGHAYADDTDQETMRDERGKGIASKRREMTIDETLRIFEEMKLGSPEGKRFCIRAKLSIDNPNKAMRDPVIYRCNDEPHHRTGTTWKMYPMYDFACPVVDSYEGITHALRSTEYTDRNPQYQWFLDTLQLRQVHMWDFARMNFIRTFLSKRKLAKLVDTGRVWGWDDPRMPTVRGVRRRGMTVAALRDFIVKQGPSRNVTSMDWTSFWAANKKEIDPVAPRHTALSQKNPVKVLVTGADAPAAPLTTEKPKHPKNKEVGLKLVTFSSELLLEQEDVALMKVGEEITLMAWGNAIVRDIQAGSPIPSITIELNLAGDVKSTEKKVTWLSNQGQTLVPAELWDFDYLITKDKLEDDDDLEQFLTPVTETMELAWCGADAASLRKDDIIQLERRGYYRVDKGLGDWKDGEDKRIVLFCIPTGKSK